MGPRPSARRLLVALVALVALGCAAEEGRGRRGLPRSPTSAVASGATRDAARDPGGAAAGSAGDGDLRGSHEVGTPSRTLRAPRFETIALPPEAPPSPARPPRRRSVDLELAGAPFEDVARLLADVGGFGLVVEAPSAGAVQASLRRVDAWDALAAICEAKGLALRYERGIALVKAP